MATPPEAAAATETIGPEDGAVANPVEHARTRAGDGY